MEEREIKQQPLLQDDLDKNRVAFEHFWERHHSLDAHLRAYESKTYHIKDEFAKFREFLREVPIVVAVGFWMKGLVTDIFWYEKYFSKMRQLQERQLIPSIDSTGQPVTLHYFMNHGHQDILEGIRCVREWSMLEREEMVQCYVRFSHGLSRDTFGIIPHGFDPDRDRVRSKVIRYEAFLEFVQHLPERDALIAKLLYFGAPSIDEVLSLKRDAIQERSVQFETLVVQFPWHVLIGLQAYLKDKPGSQKLVFVNVRGAEVERAHLNQSFARACEKIAQSEKITPGSLLRLQGDSAIEALRDSPAWNRSISSSFPKTPSILGTIGSAISESQL